MKPFLYQMMIPNLPNDNDKPPTLYAILESMVNYDNPNPVKIKDLSTQAHSEIFDFNYPLSANIDKEEFEVQILKKFLMRRIGFDTFTAFKIQLDVKLNEIMPNYNILFDALEGWEIFKDGEVTIRELDDSKISNSTDSRTNTVTNSINNRLASTTTSDRRSSDTPQSQISEVQDGSYVTNYDYDTNIDTTTSQTTGTNNSTDNGSNNTTDTIHTKETTTRSPADKIAVYKNFIENKNNIMTMIYSDLNELFYGLV